MALLSKQKILEADDRPHRDVKCPEWGGDVRIRTMTAGERDAWEAALMDAKGRVSNANIRAKLVAATAVDEKGARVFTDEEAAQLGTKSAKVMDRLFAAAQSLNGLSARDVEDLAGN